MAWNALWTILGVMLVFLALGVPISYSIGISSLAAILATVSADAAVVTAAQRIFVGMSRFSLTAIPFFILAGNLMNQGGIAGRLVDLVLAVLGRLPGSLLVANVGANALFGAISGSASAAAAAVGSMVRDGEEEQGYDPALCAASNGASAPSGLLIPPSNASDHVFSGAEAFLCRRCSWRAMCPVFCGPPAVLPWRWRQRGERDTGEPPGNMTGRIWDEPLCGPFPPSPLSWWLSEAS